MTDVRTLLRTASPPPVTTLGINHVLEAARDRRRNRRRRLLAWASGVLLVSVGAPVTGALVNASEPSTRVETALPGSRHDDVSPTTTPARRASDPDVHRQPDGTRATTNSAASATLPESPQPVSTNEGCREDRRSPSNLQLSDGGQGGAGWDAYPSCSYTATLAGGYVAEGSWRIEITRRGALLTIESGRAPACGTDVIEPGDKVTAYLRKGVNSPSEWFIEVGSNKGC